jgi:type IV pilus assembly protein PilN
VRFDINLATRRYEDAGRFYRTWIPILVVAALLTVALSAKAISIYRETRVADREISKIDQRLAELDKQRKDAEATLARQENAGTRDTNDYLNQTFKLKTFSWTQVLSDLEKLVPNGVQVVSIKPVVVDNQVLVTMQVSATDRARVLEMVRRMEASPRFPDVGITTESSKQEGRLAIDIQATYAPPVRPQ